MDTTTAAGSWVGIDWGDRSHSVCLLAASGELLESFTIEHSAEGLDALTTRLLGHGPVLGVAIETDQHLLVYQPLRAGLPVYPVNPKIAHEWGKCLKVDPPKSDQRAAWTLASGLRAFAAHLRPLRPDDPLTRELDLRCGHECDLIASRTAFANKLKDTLKRYFPEFLEWFSALTHPTAADFLLAYPTPQALRQAPKADLCRFLRGHRIRIGPRWQALLDGRAGKTPWPSDEAAARAYADYAAGLARQLKALNATLAELRERIEALFAQHPDAALFRSLPSAGPKLAPRLLASFGSDRERYPDAGAVQALGGAVPLTRQSGGKKDVLFRWACRKDFRTTLHLFAFGTLRHSPWARAYYDRARGRGQSHALALRNLAAKWLKIIFRMWQTRTPYHEALYLRSLREHGSPLAPRLGGAQPGEGQ
jgi:hypothetical protein